MSKSVDPLLLLRDYFSNSKPIQYRSDDHTLVFGSTKIPVDSKTAWTKKVGNSQYTIGAFWFFLQRKDAPIREYMMEADRDSFEKIHLLDKNKIIEYFTGKVDQVDEIDKTKIPETLIVIGRGGQPKPGEEAKASGVSEKRDKKLTDKFTEEQKEGATKGEHEAKGDSRSDREYQIIQYLYKNEKKIVSKNSILQCPGKSFAKIYSLCAEMIGEKQRGEDFLKKVKAKGEKQIVNVNISTLKKKQKVSLLDEILHLTDNPMNEGRPIILVPGLPQAGNVNIHNISDLLCEGKYVNPVSIESSSTVVDTVTFKHPIAGHEVTFEVYDSVTTFTRYHWKRLVAIFVQGQQWQFSDFPKGESMVDIFLKVKGFYVKYEDLDPPKEVKKWNVSIVGVSRNDRYKDKGVVKEIWDQIEKFVNAERYKGK